MNAGSDRDTLISHCIHCDADPIYTFRKNDIRKNICAVGARAKVTCLIMHCVDSIFDR